MRKILTKIIFLIVTLSSAQTKNLYYTNDVDAVEYLTVKFCVDGNGLIQSHKIISEKTSYTNQAKINKVIEEHAQIIYNSRSKLLNNCYDYTFTFANQKYKEKKHVYDEYNKCRDFRKGNFRYANTRYKNVKIKRRRNKQVEVDNKVKLKYKIAWKSPCTYTLTYLKVNNDDYKYLLGKTINVEIIDVLDNTTYVYYSNLLNRTEVIGVMKKL